MWLRQASSATTAGDQDVTTSTSTTSNSSNSNDSSRLYSLKQRLKVDPMVQHHGTATDVMAGAVCLWK